MAPAHVCRNLRPNPIPQEILQMIQLAGFCFDSSSHLSAYAVRMASDLSPEMAACAAASRAIGTR